MASRVEQLPGFVRWPCHSVQRTTLNRHDRYGLYCWRQHTDGHPFVIDEPKDPVFDEAFQVQLETLLAWRRDVRRFRLDPLLNGMIESLISTASFAPSVGNAQPWRFVNVTSPQSREALANHVDATSQRAALACDPARACAYRELKLHGLREAPAVLVIFSDEVPTAGHRLGVAAMPEMLRYSTVMAIHTLWLAARARGIGLGWVSIVETQTVTALLDVPKQWSLIAVLCLGHPEHASTLPELQTKGCQSRLPVVVAER